MTATIATAQSLRTRGAAAGVGAVSVRIAPFLVLVALLLLTWELLVWALSVPSFILPAPTAIAVALGNGIRSGVIPFHTWVTFQEIALGFGAAVITAVVVAAVVTRWQLAERAFLPLITALQTVPKVALAPLFLTWFGFGITSKVVTVALLAFFPLLINLISGIQSADRERMEMFRGLGASKWQIFTRLQLPTALPYAFAGLKIAVTFSVIGAIVAEFVGAEAGLGYLIKASSISLDVATTFAVLVVLSVIGMVLTSIIGWIGNRVVFWQGRGLEAVSGS